MNDYQFDLFVEVFKLEMKKYATSKAQCDEIDRQTKIAFHKTKSVIAAIEGDLQKAFMELGIAEYKQRNY